MSETKLTDGDYILSEGAAWFSVKGFSIRIHSTDEGVVVDMYDSAVDQDGDFDGHLLATTYVYDDERDEPDCDDSDDGQALASA